MPPRFLEGLFRGGELGLDVSVASDDADDQKDAARITKDQNVVAKQGAAKAWAWFGALNARCSTQLSQFATFLS
jgi:hypothetical protein